jgi:hypothetical protein
MSDKSNKYGYVGVDIPDQSFGSNKGVFNPAEINELVADNKWTQYGQLELIETQTASNVNALDFTSIQESTYNVHFITVTNFSAVSSSTGGRLQLLESGVAKTSGYEFAYQQADLSAPTPFTEQKTTSGNSLVSYDFDPATPRNNYAYIYNAGDSSKYTFVTAQYVGINNSNLVMRFGSAVSPVNSLVNGIRIQSSGANNFDIDSVSLYGIKAYS